MPGQNPGRLWLVGHAHIDMNWVWQWPETVQVCQDTFRQVLKFMAEFPDFRFSQSQACIYEAIQRLDPGLFKKLQRVVRAGKWNIVGGMWSEADNNLSGGEGLARSCLLGQHYFQSAFGQRAKVGWLPDDFGHTAQLPQILRLAGMDGYLFMRCPPFAADNTAIDAWGNLLNSGKQATTAGVLGDIFFWQAPDGTRVLAKNCLTYNDTITEDLKDRLARLPAGVRDQLAVYGVGDHGGGPTRKDILNAKRLNNDPDYPEYVFASADDYFTQAASHGRKIPTFTGELQYIFEGCYSSIGQIKRGNRHLESSLSSAEVLATIAAQLGRPYPEKQIDDAWKTLCFNQFHDILCGSANHSSNQDSIGQYDQAQTQTDFVAKTSLRHVAEQVAVDSDRLPIVVFNTLGWQRSDVVEAELFSHEAPTGVKVFDAAGRKVPAQIRKARLFPNGFRFWVVFLAKDVPSVGYKTYFAELQTDPGVRAYQRSHHTIDPKLAHSWMRMDSLLEPLLEYNNLPQKQRDAHLKLDKLSAENRWYKITLDRRTGGISRLYDKFRKRNLIRQGQIANRLVVDLEKPHHMSAWHLGQIRRTVNLKAKSVRVIQAGPAAVTFQIISEYDRSKVLQHLTVWRDSPIIEVELQVTWLQTGSDDKDGPTLRVHFPLAGQRRELICDVPYAAVTRGGNGQEVPAHKWVAVPDKDGGFALLNDCKYGHRLKDSVLSLTLLRSSYEPDAMGDVGMHVIRYGLTSYKGGWLKADIAQKGAEFNTPLLNFESRRRKGRLPLEKSFLQVSDPQRFMLTCFKPSETGRGLVLRGYDLTGKAGRVTVRPSVPVGKAQLTNILEEPLAGAKPQTGKASVGFTVKPYKITTLKLTRRGKR